MPPHGLMWWLMPVAAGQTSQNVVVETSTTNYTFDVRAENKAGWGAYSATSAPRRGVTALAAHHRAAAEEPDSRGRRRSDDKREGAVSVAELLAQEKNKKDK